MDIVSSFLSTLAGQGIVGVVLAASFYLIWYLTRQLQKVNDQRVKDAQELTQKVVDPVLASVNGLKQQTDLLVSLFTRFLNSNANNKE